MGKEPNGSRNYTCPGFPASNRYERRIYFSFSLFFASEPHGSKERGRGSLNFDDLIYGDPSVISFTLNRFILIFMDTYGVC